MKLQLLKSKLSRKVACGLTATRGKALMLGLLACGFTNAVKSQLVSQYGFTSSAGTYTPITGGTVLVTATDPAPGGNDSAAIEDFQYAAVQLPFTFNLNGAHTSFRPNSNGWMSFGTTVAATSNTPISASTAFTAVIAPMAVDMMGLFTTAGTTTSGSNVITAVTSTALAKPGARINGTGIPANTTIVSTTANTITISANATSSNTGTFLSMASGELRYEVLGTAPNRTAVLQYSDISQYSTGLTSAGLGSYFNFQIHLAEGGGVAANQTISVVYGPCSYPGSGSTTAQVGLRGGTNSDYNNRTSTTDWSNTTAGTSNAANVTVSSSVTPPSGLTFTWNPPPPCVTPADQPTTLNLAGGASSVTGTFTPSATPNDAYLVVRTPGAAALNTNPVDGTTYTGGSTLGNGTIVGVYTGTSFTNTGLTGSTQYTYTVFSLNSQCVGGPLYNTNSPLTASITTGAPVAYSWNITTGSGDALVAANWTPARNAPDVTDTLYFNQGGSSTITNLQTSTVAKIGVMNNTTIIANSGATAIVSVSKELMVEAGSTLELSGTSNLTLNFVSGNSPTATIAGNLRMTGTGTSTFAAANSVTTVAGGSLYTANNGAVTGSLTTLILQAGSSYEHARNGGSIPTALYSPSSTVVVTGITSTSLSPVAKMPNVVWNCPLQTVANSWTSTVDSLYGSLTILSTGTGRIEGGNNPDIQIMGDFIQVSGDFAVGNYTSGVGLVEVFGTTTLVADTLLLNSNTSGGATYTFRTHGNVLQTPTHYFDRLNSVASTVNTVVFAGTAPVNIELYGTTAKNISFTLNNPAGATLTGVLNINANAIHTITNGTWTGAGVVMYNQTASTLAYNGTGTQTATDFEYPAINGPLSLTLNKTAGTILNMSFDRTIPGTLTLTNGDINLGANNLTVGTSATATGSISGTGGMIRITTGSLTRWFGTSGLPTAAGTGVGYFPVANAGGSNRNVSLYFSTATALTTGGSITVMHNDASTITTGLTLADGAYTVNNRTDASWTFMTNGVTLGGGSTMGARATGANLFVANNVANLRLMHTNSFPGTHVAGTGTAPNYQANRNGLTLTDLVASPFHIGASSADMQLLFIAIASGDWSDPATWNMNMAPSITDYAFISSGVAVDVNGTSDAARSVNILNGGTLTINTGGMLTVDSAILNAGTLNVTDGDLMINGGTGTNGYVTASGSVTNISGGVMTIGPAGGGNKRFTAGGGTVNITGGELFINGNMAITSGNFNQTNGDIIIDGNSGTAGTSVATGTHIFTLSSTPIANFTGGNIIFVDPPHSSVPAGSTTTRTLNVASNMTNANFSGTHTIQFGDGMSTTGGNTDGFVAETFASGRVLVNNVIVNGGATGNRWLTASVNNSSSFGFHVRGDVTINSGSELRTGPAAGSTNEFNVYGNIINDGTLVSMSAVTILGNNTSITQYTTNTTQSVSGAGTFANNVTGSTAMFRGLTINNAGGIDMSTIGDVPYSGTIAFTLGKLYMGNNLLIQNANAGLTGASQTTGWVVGRLQKNAATGAISHTYQVGDSTYYTPVAISGGAGSVLTAGDIAVGSVPGDHPTITYAQLNPALSVNRHYTVEALNGISFNPGALTLTLNWNAADVDAGANTAAFVSAKNVGGTTWVNETIGANTATSIQITGAGADITGDYQVAEFLQIPLLVKLASFDGTQIGDANRLDWKTASETTGDAFELQRSTEGNEFATISTIAAKGAPSMYSYTDRSFTSDVNYYRLKMTDLSGKIAYSDVVRLARTSTVTNVDIYPNPATDVVNIRVNGAAVNASVTVMDVNGKVVRNAQVTAQQATINIADLAPGLYMMKYTAGDHTETIRLIKK